MITMLARLARLVAGGWWLVVAGGGWWWLVAGGWWLVAGGWWLVARRCTPVLVAAMAVVKRGRGYFYRLTADGVCARRWQPSGPWRGKWK
jgi:hypothetical protein